MSQYSMEEVFQFAKRIEENGAELYAELARRFADQGEIAAFFGKLAQEEAEHDRHFERMAAEVMKERGREPLDELEQQYLWLFAENAVFDKEALAQKLADLKSLDDAFEFAIGCEQNAIAYYIKMKDWVDVAQHPALERLIAEETGHQAALQQKRRAQRRGGSL